MGVAMAFGYLRGSDPIDVLLQDATAQDRQGMQNSEWIVRFAAIADLSKLLPVERDGPPGVLQQLRELAALLGEQLLWRPPLRTLELVLERQRGRRRSRRNGGKADEGYRRLRDRGVHANLIAPV